MKKQRRKNNRTPSLLLDASVFVLVLTGLTYFLGFNYKQGFLKYYGIDRLMLDNIGMYYINTSFKNLIFYISFISLITLIIKLVFNYVSSRLLVNKDPFGIIKIWIQSIKNNHSLKFIVAVVTLLILSILFSIIGNISASSKSSYLVIKTKTNPLVVLDQNGDKLLVAQISSKEKGIISQKYMVIESKSTIDKPLKFEKYYFADGLKVKKVEEIGKHKNGFISLAWRVISDNLLHATDIIEKKIQQKVKE